MLTITRPARRRVKAGTLILVAGLALGTLGCLPGMAGVFQLFSHAGSIVSGIGILTDNDKMAGIGAIVSGASGLGGMAASRLGSKVRSTPKNSDPGKGSESLAKVEDTIGGGLSSEDYTLNSDTVDVHSELEKIRSGPSPSEPSSSEFGLSSSNVDVDAAFDQARTTRLAAEANAQQNPSRFGRVLSDWTYATPTNLGAGISGSVR